MARPARLLGTSLYFALRAAASRRSASRPAMLVELLMIASGVLIAPGANCLSMNLKDMARPERFELPTTWFEARYSIQLSYGR